VVGYGTGNLPTQARSTVVDLRALRAQRLPNMEIHRERLPSLRLKRLRLGSSAKRLRRSTEVLDSPGSTTTHHLQGVEGGAMCNTELPAGAQRTAASSALRQQAHHRCDITPRVEVARNDVRAAKVVLDDVQVRHQDSHALHSQRGQHLGRLPQLRHRQLRLATCTMKIQALQWDSGHAHQTNSRPPRTNKCLATTQNGGTGRRKKWSAYANQTRTGGGSITIVTLRGSYWMT